MDFSKRTENDFDDLDSVDLINETSQIEMRQVLTIIKKREEEIDRRESVLNAQIAEFESEMRKINQIIQTTQEKLQNQEAELNRQTQEFESQKKDFQQTKQLFYEQSKRILDELTSKNRENIAV
ncbi:MAG: hypothetical protein Q4C95_01225 [Planctomycetia bacterium]|nr:hypothetical protein [Planctomycetia bacterium]